jgi:carbon-monoxide dehydrogenase large subunit
MVDVLAQKLGMDPADLRFKNFIPSDKFPYRSALGWEYDSGNYPAALKKAMEKIGYADLRKEQAEKRARGELMGIGISSFTEIVGAGPSKHFDILGIKMFDSCEIRVHPTGKATARLGTKSQGQGHETTYAQIIAEELGIAAAHIEIEEADTDTAPYGLGTYASRSTPTAGAAAAVAARKIREKAKKIAAHLLEVSEEDLVWEPGKFSVKGAPQKAKTIQEIALAAYTNHPPGMEAGLEAVNYYDPPNLTFPFGSYIAVVDIDRGTGAVKIRRFVAVDDCGNIINPMIVEGQIHGGLTMGDGAGAVRGDPVRRVGQHSGRQLHGLPGADGDGNAALGDRQHRHALAAPSLRCQGSRRVRHRRCAAGDRQCRCRRARASWRAPHRHPDYAGEGVAHPAREGSRGIDARRKDPR